MAEFSTKDRASNVWPVYVLEDGVVIGAASSQAKADMIVCALNALSYWGDQEPSDG